MNIFIHFIHSLYIPFNCLLCLRFVCRTSHVHLLDLSGRVEDSSFSVNRLRATYIGADGGSRSCSTTVNQACRVLPHAEIMRSSGDRNWE